MVEKTEFPAQNCQQNLTFPATGGLIFFVNLLELAAVWV